MYPKTPEEVAEYSDGVLLAMIERAAFDAYYDDKDARRAVSMCREEALKRMRGHTSTQERSDV